MTFFDCTADLVGQLNGNGQKGMLQTGAPPVENFWLRHWFACIVTPSTEYCDDCVCLSLSLYVFVCPRSYHFANVPL